MPRMRPRRAILLLLTLVLALGIGFIGGRRVPHGLFERIRDGEPLNASERFVSPWISMEPAPFEVAEAAATTINGTLYIFGGFKDAALHARTAVWTFDPVKSTWRRLRDMPRPLTHVNAVYLNGEVWLAGGFTGDHPGQASDGVLRYDPVADRWKDGPGLPARRGGGGLAAVGSTLHFFGGYKEDRTTSCADHWVLTPAGPDSLRWKPAAPLPIPRGHLAAITLDGMVYAIGGSVGHDHDPIDVSDVERYNPDSDTWSPVASLPLPASHFEPGTFIWHGRIVVLGGRSRPRGEETLTLALEYDPSTNRWTALPSLPAPRLAPIGAVVPGGMIIGLGGLSGSKPDVRTFYRFRDSTTWVSGDTLRARLGGVAAGLIRDRVYVVGEGSDGTFALDLASGRWDERLLRAARPAPGHHHAAEVWNDKLYLFGGLNRGQGVVQVYDPATDSWRLGPPMPFAGGSVSTALIGDFVYAAGGIVGDTTTRQAARFDLVREVWMPIAPMPRGRNQAASGTDGARFYVFGGRDGSNVVANGFADVQVYDPASDTWIASRDVAPVPQARGGMGKAVYLNGEFYIIGGETTDGAGASRRGTYARVDIYDPRANTWRSGPAMTTPRHGIFPLAVDGRIYVLGGGVQAGHSASGVSEILLSARR